MHTDDNKAGSSSRLRFHLVAYFVAWAETDVVFMHGIIQDMSDEYVPWTRPFASRCCYDGD
jgi:hypothetical protein